ncbi:MAG: hypothetical protein IKS22_08170 [Bacteroidales bacterium]|nr:hypothetical protein [Bacteroidales bacterium]
MKSARLFFLLSAAILLLSGISSPAQNSSWREDLDTHPEYLGGTDMLCPWENTALSKAPRGYKPFYISHYGRHGARYAWQSDMYSSLKEVFTRADTLGLLTSTGKQFKEKFDIIYPQVKDRTGDLSRKGWEQQQNLASLMYTRFKRVFRKGAHVMARVSTSTRCIMTMSAFCLGLKAKDPKLDIFENFGYSFLQAILPLDSHNPYKASYIPTTPVKFEEKWAGYIERTIDYEAILSRIFTDPVTVLGERKHWDFVSYLYFFGAGMNSLDTDLDFNFIFTPEERIALWKIDNFQFYAEAYPTHLGYQPIVNDIIEKADERIASGQRGADLRFGHDYTFLPLLMCLGVNGYGHAVDNPDDIPVWSRIHDVPMGANLNLVFYKKKKKDSPVLFKVLLNGNEATLPMETDCWPYYDWEAFKKSAYLPVMLGTTSVSTTVPEVSGLCQSPDGEGFLAASDEDGVYKVSVSGETTPFYTSYPLDCEGVTLDPATGDVYYVLEGDQKVMRLRSGNYSSPELICTVSEYGMGTNRGLEGISWYKDSSFFIGNQNKPNMLMLYSLKEGFVMKKELTGTKEIAGLCYDPLRDALWIADSDERNINLCTLQGDVLATYPVPFIDNGEAIYIDHERNCIWVGDDTTSNLYRIEFQGL